MDNKMIAAVVAVVVIVAAGVGAFIIMNNNNGGSDYGTVEVVTPLDYSGQNYATQYYDKVPERVVCGCNTALNLLLYLGLGDKIIGCYYMEEEVWDEVADEYAKLQKRIGSDRILTGNIDQATLTSWEPDCVIAWVAWTENKLGTPEYWNALGCNVWSLRTMTDKQTMEGMELDYKNIGAVFDVSKKTDSFMKDFKEEVASLQGILAESSKGVAINDGGINESKGTMWFYDTGDYIGYLLDYLGMDLAIAGSVDLAQAYEKCGEIDVLFLVCYGDVTYEGTLAEWKADSVLKNTPAIVNNNTLPIKLSVAYGADPSMSDVVDYLVELLS